MKRFMVLLGTTFLVTACAGEKSTMVQSVQKKDKELSCTEVLLEMNEAEYYKNSAEDKKQPSLKNVIMPLGYVSTYMNSEEAISAANSRINYLNKIYEIMHCDKDKDVHYSKAGSAEEESLAQVKENIMAPAPEEGYAQQKKEAGYGPYAQAERKLEPRKDEYAAPVPYVQVNPAHKPARYARSRYMQPLPEAERYIARAPYRDNGYTPIRQRYEDRRRNSGQDYYYGYGYEDNALTYEESIPEGAPIRSSY